MGIEKADNRNGYVLYKTWHPIIETLPDAQAGQLFKAIAEYHDGNKGHTLENAALNSIFEMMKRTFANDAAKYEEVCQKRSAAGKKGGRPPGKKGGETKQKKAKETKCFSEKAKKADIDKDIDKDIEIDKDISCAPPLYVSAPNVPALILNDGSEWRPTQDDINGWCSLYSAVDIIYEMGKMREWCKSNPTKRKTKRGIRSFVTKWLGGEQDKRHSNSTGGNGSGGSGRQNRNAFNNFEQNSYDFDTLEKEILNN